MSSLGEAYVLRVLRNLYNTAVYLRRRVPLAQGVNFNIAYGHLPLGVYPQMRAIVNSFLLKTPKTPKTPQFGFTHIYISPKMPQIVFSHIPLPQKCKFDLKFKIVKTRYFVFTHILDTLNSN